MGDRSSDARHLLSLLDLKPGDVHWIVKRSVAHFRARQPPTLTGHVVGIYFESTSTRTRTAFTSAALRMGAGTVVYGPGDLQTNTGETFADTGRVLGQMLDCLVARMPADDDRLAILARHGGPMTVVNAMSKGEHPTQAVSDLAFLYHLFGRLDDLHMLYLGEGNNTATALAAAFALVGGHLELRTPPRYGLPTDHLERVRLVADRHGATVNEVHDAAALPPVTDAVYTTRWQTTGTAKADPDWRRDFEPFSVTEAMLARYPDAVFLHDLPAHRGEEVSTEVLEGVQSAVFPQARMKACSAMAVLEWCLIGDAERDGLALI